MIVADLTVAALVILAVLSTLGVLVWFLSQPLPDPKPRSTNPDVTRRTDPTPKDHRTDPR